MIAPMQCRAARALLGWTQTELANAAGVGLSTVVDFEAGRRQPISRNLDAIRSALETGGAEFIASGNGGPGVRLNTKSKDEPMDALKVAYRKLNQEIEEARLDHLQKTAKWNNNGTLADQDSWVEAGKRLQKLHRERDVLEQKIRDSFK